MACENNFPVWNANEPEKSIMDICQWSLKDACKRIHWYEKKRLHNKKCSRLIRALSIALLTVSALCPIMDGFTLLKDYSLPKWGYAFAAIAAAILGFDKYFGLSSGWIRYMRTQFSLERLLKEFHYDWISIMLQQPHNFGSLMQRIKEFTFQIEALVKEETDTWANEFQNNIAELEKALKAIVETRKPGDIKIIIPNVIDFKEIRLFLNGNQVKGPDTNAEYLIKSIIPGRYEITALGISKKDNKEYKETKVVEVQSGIMASKEIMISIP